MIRVLTCGSFDLLHYGHINMFERARSLGDWLAVGVASDEHMALRGKVNYFDFNTRCKMVSAIRYVDLVVPEQPIDRPAEISMPVDIARKLNIDIFVMGDDYENAHPLMKGYDEMKAICEILYLPRTPEISTTRLKEDLRK